MGCRKEVKMTETPKSKKKDVTVEKSAEEQRKVPKAPEAEVKTPAAKTSAPEASTGEEKPSTEEVIEVSEAPEKVEKLAETEELTEEEKKQLSEKAQKRYRKLDKKAKDAEQKAAELEKEIEKLRETQEQRFTIGIKPPQFEAGKQPLTTADSRTQPASQDRPTGQLPWAEKTPPQEERVITEDDYKRDVIGLADYIVRARLDQHDKANRIKSDLKDMESKYSELNPDSPDYSVEMSEKLSELFETQVRVNPDARLKTFVNDIMSLRKSGEEKGKAEVTAKLVEQKAEEAVTPSEVAPPPDESFEDMTLEEKEKYMKEHGLW